MDVFNTSDGAKSPLLVKAGRATLSIDGEGTMLALNCQIQFQRNVEVVPTIGNQRVLSVGEPQGTMSIQTLISNSEDSIDKILGKDEGCEGFTLEVDLDADGTCGMSGKTLVLSGCVSSSVSVELQGGRGYVASGVQITFTALDM